jgi:hypothetical protein
MMIQEFLTDLYTYRSISEVSLKKLAMNKNVGICMNILFLVIVGGYVWILLFFSLFWQNDYVIKLAGQIKSATR